MRTTSSFCILHLCRIANLLPEVAAEVLRRPHISLAPQKRRHLQIHTGQLYEPRNMLRIELHQKIDIALRRCVAAQNGSEKRQPLYVVAPAEISDFLAGEVGAVFVCLAHMML